MQIGIIGLGKMGGGIIRRLHRAGLDPIGYARSEKDVNALEADGIRAAHSFDELAKKQGSPCVFWLMVPSGPVVDSVIESLEPQLGPGCIIVDGGNSNYKDSMRRGKELEARGIHFVDAGVSGGVWGLEGGYCMMVGGSDEAVDVLRPVFEALAPAPDKGWGHMGPCGSGHFVKMVHNGIEYGLMQAYAEGFAIMEAKKEFGLDLEQISNVWQYGSVIRSWLLELVELALQAEGHQLEAIAPHVTDSGMGRWTANEAIELSVPAPVLTHSLMARFESRDTIGFHHRMLAALRNQFGGHAMQAAEADEKS
ncbi:MAG: phosphogluconate dehydrogenase (NAD(+)-dependent, decarboxylating) [Rhodothermales bacterium]